MTLHDDGERWGEYNEVHRLRSIHRLCYKWTFSLRPFMIDPKTCSVQDLLHLYVEILEELRSRKILRTANSPVGDYAEWLVANRLGLTLASNSTAGYDALDDQGTRYQIKCRRITREGKSPQLSAIRNLSTKDFDFLIVLLFDHGMEIDQVYKIPHSLVGQYAVYRKHVNAHILIMRGPILSDPCVENITHLFRDLAAVDLT